MTNASFMQTSFLGGEWSSYSEGRMDSERYKTAMKVSFNGYALEEGSWTRRQGTRFVATTKGGLAAKLLGFSFSVDLPFQVEFGNAYLRVFFGQSQVFTDDEQEVLSISAATPAVVTTGTHGWVDDDTVMFFFESGQDGDQNDNAPTLRNRQFTIDQLSGSTFALYDGVTGEAVDGSTLDYTGPGGTVKRIFELATPYVGNAWQTVRRIQNESEVILLQGSYPPERMSIGTNDLFELDTAAFLDGPYLDPPPTSNTTTLDPSGVSGSVTLVASATTNINDGQGFLTTDVGRSIRLLWEPAAWSSASTYAVGDLVKYNDQYFVNIVATAASAPTPERDVTSWSYASDAIVWTWGLITARASTTSVTFNILGPALPDATARLVWRLGVYSDTTGWPTIGAFHDGRLWLGGVVPNRLDGSVANSINGPFDFQPTLADGTVTDANAISAVANSEDRNTMVWMTTNEEGLLVGTEGGEWRGRASANNDSISPTSFDFRRVSKTKSFDTEPARAPTMLLTVQLARRKVMEWGYFQGDGYKAAHLSVTGRHLTTSGIEEIQYQHEPVPTVWCRRTDGGLIGSVYKRDPESGYHAAWFQVELAAGRMTTSISNGASLSGLSEALWQVSLGEDGVHFVEIMTPVFEDDTENWQAWFVDDGITPQAGKLVGTDILFYGFWPLVGIDVAVMVNGIDLGDFTVSATGVITVPLGATGSGFTLADLQTLTDAGTDYGDFTVYLDMEAQPAPADESGNIMAHIGAESEVTDTTGTEVVFDANKDFIVVASIGNSSTDGLRRFKMSDEGAEVLQNNIEGIFGPSSGKYINYPLAHDSRGYVYVVSSIGNSRGIDKIEVASLTSVGEFGGYSNSILADGSSIPAPSSACCIRSADGYDFHVSCGIIDGSVTFVNVSDMVFAGQSLAVDEDGSGITEGARGTGVAWGLGVAAVYPSAAAIGLYKFLCDVGAGGWTPTIPISAWATAPNTLITKTKIGTITPAEVDATWTRFHSTSAPVYDRNDGHIMFHVSGDNGGAPIKYYVVKVNTTTCAVMWATEVNSVPNPGGAVNQSLVDDNRYVYYSTTITAANERPMYTFNTTTGAVTTTTWTGVSPGAQAFDSITGSVICFGQYSDIAGTFPAAEIGDYFDTHVTDTFNDEWMRLFVVAPAASGGGSLRVYNRIPAVVGPAYESRGQLLRPDYGNDAGAANGPAFGKTRRLHEYSAYVLRTRGMEIGVDFNNMYPADGQANEDGSAFAAGVLYTGLVSGTINADYDTENKIAWKIQRPYPLTVTAVAGYLATQDR